MPQSIKLRIPKCQIDTLEHILALWNEHLFASITGTLHPSRVLFYYLRIKCGLTNLRFSKKSKNFFGGGLIFARFRCLPSEGQNNRPREP